MDYKFIIQIYNILICVMFVQDCIITVDIDISSQARFYDRVLRLVILLRIYSLIYKLDRFCDF